MIRKRNVRTRRSAVLTAFAASAREWNGEPATACPAAAGAAKTGLAPPPPSIPGDAEIDSVAGAAPVFVELSRSMLSSHLLPRTQSPDDRSKLQLAYKILRSPDTAAPRKKLPSGKRPVNWADRFAVRPRGSSTHEARTYSAASRPSSSSWPCASSTTRPSSCSVTPNTASENQPKKTNIQCNGSTNSSSMNQNV